MGNLCLQRQQAKFVGYSCPAVLVEGEGSGPAQGTLYVQQESIVFKVHKGETSVDEIINSWEIRFLIHFSCDQTKFFFTASNACTLAGAFAFTTPKPRELYRMVNEALNGIQRMPLAGTVRRVDYDHLADVLHDVKVSGSTSQPHDSAPTDRDAGLSGSMDVLGSPIALGPGHSLPCSPQNQSGSRTSGGTGSAFAPTFATKHGYAVHHLPHDGGSVHCPTRTSDSSHPPAMLLRV